MSPHRCLVSYPLTCCSPRGKDLPEGCFCGPLGVLIFAAWKARALSPAPCKHISHSPSLSLLLLTSSEKKREVRRSWKKPPPLVMGFMQGQGLDVLLRVPPLSSGDPDPGLVREVCAGPAGLAPCVGRGDSMPCKIYECVLLIALVALQEENVCFGLKQDRSYGGIQRGDRTKAVFKSLLRCSGCHGPLSHPLLMLGLFSTAAVSSQAASACPHWAAVLWTGSLPPGTCCLHHSFPLPFLLSSSCAISLLSSLFSLFPFIASPLSSLHFHPCL